MFYRSKKKAEPQTIDLINMHIKTIRKILSYRLHSPSEQDLEDCEQEVFLIIASEITNILKHPHIEGWICVCCRNVATNYNSKVLDKLNNIVELEENLSDNLSLEDVVINQIIYNNAIDNRALEKILLSLSDSDKVLYSLKWVDKIEEKQIAEQLGISLSAVKNRIARLRRKIQLEVKKYT